MAEGRWVRWHDAYGEPGSSLSRRLLVVRRRLREAIDAAPAGPLAVLSLCAGQGRDVVGVLRDHPRAADVSACLVELDRSLASAARASAEAAGLGRVEVREGDASLTDTYADAVPADVVLVCGVFGNVRDGDIHTTIAELPHLCAMQATVIWTRHRRAPDITPRVRAWFAEAGFEEVAFDTEEGTTFGVGTHRLVGPTRPLRTGGRLFTFVEGDAQAAR